MAAKLHTILNEFVRSPGINVVFVRSGQSLGNYAGSLVGWTDSKLAIKGRQQSNKLYAGLYSHVNSFKQIYTSDLSRSINTAQISLGFPTKPILKDKRLRQINFGDDQGKHFDSLNDKEKERINSIEYKAINGQSWQDVRKRVGEFYKGLDIGTYLLFSHGGVICTQTYDFGEKDVTPNCSAVGLTLNPQTKKVEKLNFVWRFPQEAAQTPL